MKIEDVSNGYIITFEDCERIVCKTKKELMEILDKNIPEMSEKEA